MSTVLPGLPGQHELRFWIPPHQGSLIPQPGLETPAGTAVTAPITVMPLRRVQEQQIGYRIRASHLTADQSYRLRVSFGDGTAWTSKIVRTLPDRVSDSFTIAVGSCYAFSEDRGQIVTAYPPERYRFADTGIRIRFLTGDQVYIDIDPTSGWPYFLSPPDPWDLYRRHWMHPDYARFLAASPTAYLADDHEYWNDFPHQSLWLAWSRNGMQNSIAQAADEAFTLYQTALNPAPGEEGSLPEAVRGFCRSFTFAVPPLSFFALDTRTGRTPYDAAHPGFIRQQTGGIKPELERLRTWVQGLQGPGILIIAQPLVEEPASSFTRFFHLMADAKLPDYGQDFLDVWQAVLRSNHNILVVTGDIHKSRLTSVKPISMPGASGKPAFELAASPLVHIKLGWEHAPEGSVNLDTSGHLRHGYSAEAWHRVGTAERRLYATLEFQPRGPRVFCQAVFWAAQGTGARPIAEDTIWLE